MAPIKGNDNTLTKRKPAIAVTVIACYPRLNTTDEEGTLDVLIQDYRLHNEETASFLADAITEWAVTEVENKITERFSNDAPSSSLRHIIETCDVAMTSMPADGKPCVVIATDCKAVKCESVLTLVRSRLLKDTSLVSLSISFPPKTRVLKC